jgi:hypothetical protein
MKTLFIVFAAVFLVSCSSSNKDSLASPSLSLNNGQKWEVNAEMKPFIESSHEMLNTHISSNDVDYKALAKALKDQNTKLIKSCTMKGKSHEELHKWLHPHMGLIDDLKKAKNGEEANLSLAALESSFKEYQQYFK